VLSLVLVLAAALVGGALSSAHSAAIGPLPSSPEADAHVEIVHDRPADHLTAFDRDLFFTSLDPGHGVEVWRSNGTAEGTALLKDVKKGKPSSYPTGLTATKDGLYFFARGTRGRTDLWKSDGTRSGTVVVKRNLWVNTYDVESVGIGRLLYFFAFTGRQDPLALWRSDGTAAGTFPVMTNVKLGWPDPTSSDDDADDEMVAVGNRLFFAADGDRNGTELWVSNGTKRGTTLVRDIVTKRNKGAEPAFLTAVGNMLYFTANDGKHGRELWRSNGRSAGTTMVADFTSDPFRDPGPGELTVVGQTLFLTNDRYYPSQLWKSDGTEAGTEVVAEVEAAGLAGLDDTLYFHSSASGDHEVWTSDGTPEGTAQLTALGDDCVSPDACRDPSRLTAAGDSVYFPVSARDDNGVYVVYELWMTDGTLDGTGRIQSFTPPGSNAEPPFDPPVEVAGVPYFVTNNDNGEAQGIIKVVDGALSPTG
jgi:ELWxxDGT repeat protein